jgi:hypothetical protein
MKLKIMYNMKKNKGVVEPWVNYCYNASHPPFHHVINTYMTALQYLGEYYGNKKYR